MKNINAFNLDIIKEVANIASGNAITALAEFLGKDLDIYISKVEKINLREIPTLLGPEETITFAILQEILTGFEGEILFTIDEQGLKKIIYEICNKYKIEKYNIENDIDILYLDELEISLIQEIGNILTGSYLSAIATLLDTTVNPSCPIIAIDMAAAILVPLVVDTYQSTDEVFFVQTQIFLGESTLNSQVLLIPKRGGLPKLVNKLKEKYNIYE